MGAVRFWGSTCPVDERGYLACAARKLRRFAGVAYRQRRDPCHGEQAVHVPWALRWTTSGPSWVPSRSGARRSQRLSLELEEAEHVVQPDDLGVLLALLRRELAVRALLRELLDARRQIVAAASSAARS